MNLESSQIDISGGAKMNEKTITIRLPENEYTAFHIICNEKGYSKTGKIREFIRDLVKDEIEEARMSAEEWSKIEAGIPAF